MGKGKWIIGIVIILLFIGGFFILPRIPELMMATGYSTANVKPLKITDIGLDFHITHEKPVSLTLFIRNPNSMSATLDSISYEVYVEDKRAGSGVIPQTTTINPESTAKVNSEIDVELGGAISGGLSGMWDKMTGEDINVRVDGKIHVNVGPTSFDIPFSKRKKF